MDESLRLSCVEYFYRVLVTLEIAMIFSRAFTIAFAAYRFYTS